MTSTTVTRCSFIVVALLLGLARAQEGGDDEPQAAQLRGNDDANAVLSAGMDAREAAQRSAAASRQALEANARRPTNRMGNALNMQGHEVGHLYQLGDQNLHQ